MMDLDELEKLLADEKEASRNRHTAGDPARRKHWKEVWQIRRQELFREMRAAMPYLIEIARSRARETPTPESK